MTSEEADQIIRKIAEKIHSYGMDVPAILTLESIKPLAFIGSQMSRLFLSPFLPILGDDISITGEKLMKLFEKRENVEKIITTLEELSNEEKKNQSSE